METKLPPCTCSQQIPEGSVCGYCHAGMDIPRSYFPELSKAFPPAVATPLENTADKLRHIKGGNHG